VYKDIQVHVVAKSTHLREK